MEKVTGLYINTVVELLNPYISQLETQGILRLVYRQQFLNETIEAKAVSGFM